MVSTCPNASQSVKNGNKIKFQSALTMGEGIGNSVTFARI